MPKIDTNPENEKVCKSFCGSCPTYPDTEEFLFCARSKSRAPKKEMGCNCGLCGVWNKYGINDFYYCRKGSAG